MSELSRRRWWMPALVLGAFSLLLTVCGAVAQDAKAPKGAASFLSGLAETKAPAAQGARSVFNKVLSAEPPPYRVQTREVDADGVPCEWFWPARLHYRRGVRAIIYVHGGGLFAGSVATHRMIAGNFAKAASADVLAVNYRLLPEEDYPAPLDDVVSAYRWLIYSGYSPANIVMAGDSFGATLAIAATLRQLESGGAPPAAIVAMSPILEMPEPAATSGLLGTDPLWRLSQIGPGENARKALVRDIAKLTKGFPPMLVQVGDQENLLAATTGYAGRAKHEGFDVVTTTWPGMAHEWQLFPARVDEARRSNQEAAEFIMQHFQEKPKD